MNIFVTIAASLLLISATLANQPYLFGTSLNTKGVISNHGVGASETTGHALDDVSQSKSYVTGDHEINARTKGQALWTNVLHGVNTSGDAV